VVSFKNTLVMKITSCSWDKNSYITANFTSINQGHTLYQASYWLVILKIKNKMFTPHSLTRLLFVFI